MREVETQLVALLRSHPESPMFRTRVSSPFMQSLGLASCH